MTPIDFFDKMRGFLIFRCKIRILGRLVVYRLSTNHCRSTSSPLVNIGNTESQELPAALSLESLCQRPCAPTVWLVARSYETENSLLRPMFCRRSCICRCDFIIVYAYHQYSSASRIIHLVSQFCAIAENPYELPFAVLDLLLPSEPA